MNNEKNCNADSELGNQPYMYIIDNGPAWMPILDIPAVDNAGTQDQISESGTKGSKSE